MKNMRLSWPWATSLASLLLTAQSAWAAPGVTIDSVGVSASSSGVASSSYNSSAAVCNGNIGLGLDVSASVTRSGYTSPSITTGPTQCVASSNLPSAYSCTTGNKVGKRETTTVEVQNQIVAISVTDNTGDANSTTLAPASANSQSGTLALAAEPDGKYRVTFSATPSEEVRSKTDTTWYCYSANNCGGTETILGTDSGTFSGWATTTGTTRTDNSQFYYRDTAGPTATHNVANPLQQVQQNTDLNLNIHVAGGSSGQDFKIRAGFVDGATDVWGPPTPDDPDSFQYNTALNDGIASPKTEAAAVLVSCSVPTGTDYVSLAQVTSSTDLCGNDYVPPAIDSSYSGGSGLFEVTANPEDCAALTNTAVVTAPLPPANLLDDPESSAASYALAQCFTSQSVGRGKAKVVSYPGTVHLGTVVHSSGDGSCTETVAVGDVVFSLDADFDFLKTGNSPQAHVFVGTPDDASGWPIDEGPGFWYHTGYPLVEIDSSLVAISVTPDSQQLTVSLGSTELGCGPGLMAKGKTLYARAHARFVGTPTIAETHTFSTSAVGLTSDVQLIENPQAGEPPQPSCVNGQLPLAEP